MKKLVYLLVAVSLVLALMPAVASADPIGVDLIAGQHADIGSVEVWNNADYLYVKFVSTGDCLLETHVAVGTSLDAIPQTKKGNPIPGQFEYSDPHTCVQEYTYDIPLTWPFGTELHIAAHAATGVQESMWVFSNGDESFTAYTGPGTTSSPCEQGEARSGTAVAAWQHSAWGSVTSQFTYGTWIWEAYRAVDPICGTVVDFEETFDIPGEFTDGTLWVTADNGYEAYLNGTLLETDGLSGDWWNSPLTESYVTTAQAAWSSIEIATWLQLTGNVLRFETANEYFNTDDGHGSAGTVDSNPGGLIYEAQITYYADGETAWGAGEPFPGNNWGTYFTYTVQHPVICADFSELDEGASVEGLGTVAPDLEIDTPTGDAVKIVEGGTTSVYGAPNQACGYTPILNGGIGADGGFSDKTAQGAQGAHSYTFTFAVAVNDFSLHMLDFGDWNPSKNTHHYASMTAYDAGDNVVATPHELEYNSDGAGNPRSSDYGDLLCGAGDAVHAEPGQPGNWTWNVSGSGIVRVELFFGDGYDPNIGFDTLCFVLQ